MQHCTWKGKLKGRKATKDTNYITIIVSEVDAGCYKKQVDFWFRLRTVLQILGFNGKSSWELFTQKYVALQRSKRSLRNRQANAVCEEFVNNFVDSIYKYYNIQIVKYLVWNLVMTGVSREILALSFEQFCQSASLRPMCFCLFNLMQTTLWIFTTMMYLAKDLAW